MPQFQEMKYYIKLSLLLILLGAFKSLSSQIVYEHISNKAIYDFLDEMANMKVIELNDLIKPYSRSFIYEKLREIEDQEINHQLLNHRQKEELRFYLKAYFTENNNLSDWPTKANIVNSIEGDIFSKSPLGSYYKDENFTMGVQPIFGATYSTNKNESVKENYGGASIYGYIGKNIGFYSNVRDNNVSQLLIKPEYFIHAQGVPVKNFGDKGVDYSEARGGLMYSWKWGAVGIVKDHIEWGLGYNGTNIQSGRTPSFAQFKLHLKPTRWFEFNYYHGWLVSEIVDSTRSYWSNNSYRVVYHPKYMAASMFTFYPIKHLNISFGNSIIYNGMGGGGPHLAYLIPFLFYKSVDITLSGYEKYGYSSNNNHFFFNISSRNIKYLHLYFSLFADDISTRYFFNKELYNSFSYKIGFRLSNFYIQNLIFTAEYTRSNPYVYQHHAETQNYNSNSYNMGHYLGGNSQEIYLALKYIPIRGLTFDLSYTLAQHGDDYDINNPIDGVHSDPILKNITWQNQNILFRARYEVVSNTYLFAEYNYQNISGEKEIIEKYTPEYYWNKTTTFSFGFNIGF